MDLYDLRFNPTSSSLFFNNNPDDFKVYAHKNELLSCHIEKTQYIFDNLKDDKVMLNFYNNFVNEGYLSISFEEFIEIINDFIFFHDVGKLSFSFQIKRLNKKNFPIKTQQLTFLSNNDLSYVTDNFEENHSFSGALLFLSKYKDIIQNNILFILLLAYTIYGHHSSLKDVYENSGFAYSNFSNKDINTVSSLLLFLNIADINQIENFEFDQSFFQTIQNLLCENKTPQDSTFSFFYNYIYSLLISSDVMASKEYNIPLEDVKRIKFNNRINPELQVKMKNSFYNVEYNQDISNRSYLKDLEEIKDINLLRRNMLLESSYNLSNSVNNKIFFLNLPTGGGKTNTSMKLALDLLELTDANRIIYAMPFINIIEQNYDIIRDNFGLNEDKSEIRKIYSATETLFNEKDDEFKSKIIMQDSFFNYPVICTTFSTFFDSILRVKKGYKYKLSALTNSIVILDEVQSLPLRNWNSLYYLINEIAVKFNIYFIVMSATLPQFNKLKLDSENIFEYNNSISLINNPENYFNHYLFDRTQINGGIKELSVKNKSEIKNFLNNIIQSNFNKGYTKGLIVLNTIKSSKLIYDLLNEYDDFEIDLLNSSLLYNIKQKIIYKINNMKSNSKRYVLISTQSIEAGVDVSFDFVIRDFAILDSIEQVRGRCNRSRELNKKDPYKKGNIYLINLKDKDNYIHEYIYDHDEIYSRILETRQLFENCDDYNYEDILNYYSSVSEDINELEDNKEDNFIFNDRNNIYFWNNLEYSKLQDRDGIHIIYNDLKQYSIFIPINMNILHEFNDSIDFSKISITDLKQIYLDNEKNFVFSFKELEFLKKIENNSSYSFINEGYVVGNQLIEYYKYIIKEYKRDINSLNIIQKEFSSILYKFIVNLTINNQDIDDKITFEFEKVGYFYIMDEEYIGDEEENIYSIETGLNQIPKIVEIL